MSDIVEWLDHLGLAKYGRVFVENEVDLGVLPRLSEPDLRELGLPVGARKKILRAVAELRGSPRSDREQEAAVAAPERRQITVMFTDVVESTSLSGRIDAEDLRSLVLAYQHACTEAIEQCGGYVAQYLGDGVLAYFGYPQAHEDDAVRAVRAAVSLIERMPEINRRLVSEHGMGLEIRAGLHTGLVVAGEMGAGRAREHLAVGETPNIAARVQGVAEPGCVVVSEATWRLVDGFFTAEPLGPQAFKGVTRPVEVYRVIAPTGVAPFEVRAARWLTPLVGRKTELALLRKCWDEAAAGRGQGVLLQGEAGIGKSRLVRAFRDLLQAIEHQAVTLNCSAQYETSPFYPVVDQFCRAAGFEPGDDAAAKRGKLSRFVGSLGVAGEHIVNSLAALLGIATHDNGSTRGADPSVLRREAVDAVVRVVAGLAETHPLLLIVEDIHWIDASTEELIGHLLDAIPHRRVIMVLTARPAYHPPWASRSHVRTLSLRRLSRRESDVMIRRVAGTDLSAEVCAQLATKADGIPLFIEELTKSVLDSGTAREPRSIAVPATLQDALTARLDRLAPVRELIQVAALLGRAFDADVVQAVTRLDRTELERALNGLVEAGLVYGRVRQPRRTFEFKHALVQDAALSTLLRHQKALLSGRIAEALERIHPELGQQPEVLAHHLTEAGDDRRAWPLWRMAGDLAVQRSASHEAASHFARATECLERLGPGATTADEKAAIYLAFSFALMQSEGYRSERLARAMHAAREAAGSTASGALRAQVVVHTGTICHASGRNAEYLALVDGLEPGLVPEDAPAMRAGLIATQGVARYNLGRFDEAAADFHAVLNLLRDLPGGGSARSGGANLCVVTRSYAVMTLRALGRLEQAARVGLELKDAMPSPEDPFSVAWAFNVLGNTYLMTGDYERSVSACEECIAICREYGFKARMGTALIRRGVARAHLGQLELGTDDVREGLSLWRGAGTVFNTPEWSTWLAELLLAAGRAAEANAVLDDADALVRGTDELAGMAESQRLRWMLAAAAGDTTEAERWYEDAIATARGQGAALFELRATTRLAELLASQGRDVEAACRLGAVYASLTEGHHAPELRAAKALLDRLQGSSSAPAP